ncbi:alginate lyase family protein [Streptomyces sp. NPDC048290]|uniref:alginate lyase family protein n=1 Tax=Streptomyces sp. NPDC048290 TaxID=3155811 RepID=UPI00344A46E7
MTGARTGRADYAEVVAMRGAGGRAGRNARRPAALALAALVLVPAAGCGTLDSGSRARTHVLAADQPFTHPGVLVGKAQLDAVRKNVTAGKQPWLTAYLDMRDSEYGSYKYRARPVADVSCPGGDVGDVPGAGCVEEREDAIAAYTQALLFTVTGKRRHAAKAAEIMDAWSARLTRHSRAGAGLQAGWTGGTWARAAEIVRHTEGAGWPKDRVRRFATMLRTAHLPHVTGTAPDRRGDRDLTAIDAALSIAVFLDDRKTFDASLARFRERVPSVFYLEKDGPLPRTQAGSAAKTPEQVRASWFRQRTFKDGLTQETCRGFAHVGHAVAATAHAAETAWQQGVDLYEDAADRLRAALALHAPYQEGRPAPGWLCGGRIERDLGPALEVALNHLENRLDTPVPAAHRLAVTTRPAGTDGFFVAWETLTHAGNPGT